jgi:hypothetical protein
MWTGLTNGFHMDIDAGSVTIENGDRYNPIYKFDAGVGESLELMLIYLTVLMKSLRVNLR